MADLRAFLSAASLTVDWPAYGLLAT